MINTKTVFVLGAGASIPYGFPSGAELREILCAPSSKNFPDKYVDWKTSLARQRRDETESLRFSDAFLKSGVASIDSFLSRRSNEFGEIGKLAIAAILCAREEPSRLHRTDNEDDWYCYLWNALVAGVHKCDDLASNQIRFVTFNYDRSLEYFLLQSCRETFGVDDNEARRALEPLKILHVYGQLGKLERNRSSDARPYETIFGNSELSVAANGIKIIPESRDDAPEFEEARELFEWAQKICFLGFGFDPLNVSRLNLESVLVPLASEGRSIRVLASTYGKTLAENSAIKRSIVGALPKGFTLWSEFDRKNLMTLRESGVLL